MLLDTVVVVVVAVFDAAVAFSSGDIIFLQLTKSMCCVT